MNTETKLIKTKVGLINLAEQLGNVSQACKVMGYSRDSFYRVKELYQTGAEVARREARRQKPVPKNRVAERVELAVASMVTENPALGEVRSANELRKSGIFISPCGVRCVWQRHELETLPKLLKA